MRHYLSRRLLIGAISLVGISLIGFVFVYQLPGDPVSARYPNITLEERDRIRERMGLNDPLPGRYVAYVEGLFKGDWGQSHNTGRPVIEDLGNRVPASLELATYSMVVAAAVGIPLGIVAAINRRRFMDSVVRVVASTTLSVPVFWSSLVLIFLFFSVFEVAPSPVGRLATDVAEPRSITRFYTIDSLITGDFSAFWSSLKQLALPITALSIFLIGPIIKISRAAMIETLQQRYILTARALGVPERTVLLNDALRNSSLSIVTLIGILAGYLVTGDALVEKVFSWPGLGLYMVNAVVASDHAVVQGGLIATAFAILSINLVLDMTYALLDPRIRVSYQIT